jgi:hypothetical protein
MVVEAADAARVGRPQGGATTFAGTSQAGPSELTERGSPTFRFLVACVGCAIDPSARTRVSAIDLSPVDWDLLQKLARENRVDVLLLHGLRKGPAPGIPPDVIARLETYEVGNRRRNAASLVVLDSILGALSRQGTRCLLFKGPVLGQQAYPDAGMRFSWDLDLLVRKTDLPAVHDLLRLLRYERDALSERQQKLYECYHFAHTYSPTGEGPDIDVHWSLFPANFPIPVDYAGLQQRSAPIDIGGIRATTFSREDTLVYLAAHGAKEEWRRLQMIADVAAMVTAHPDLDWQACWRIADQWRARRKLLLALYLASSLGAALPPGAAQRIELDAAVRVLAQDVLRRLQQLAGRSTSIFEYSRWRALSFDRASDRIRYAWRTITAPRLEHLALLKVPRLPFSAYVPIRLVHDYVAIPVRDWGRRSRRRFRSRSQ